MDEVMSPIERDALLGVINHWAQRVSEDISKIVNKTISISDGTQEVLQPAKLKEKHVGPRVIGTIELENEPPFYVMMGLKDTAVMIDLFMGGDGTGAVEEFTDIQTGILEEMFNQMGNSFATTLAELIGKKHKCLPPKVQMNGVDFLPAQLFCVNYKLKYSDLIEGPFIVLIGTQQAAELGTQITHAKASDAGSKRGASGAGEPKPGSKEEREVYAKSAQFPQLNAQAPLQRVGNLELIFDVLLQLTAVLGRTGITIKDLVELGPGSVLELDKLAGEPVELYANNKLVAKGEVVVIDERFAIRVTETVSPVERLQGLKSQV